MHPASSQRANDMSIDRAKVSEHLHYLWSVLNEPESRVVDQRRIDDAVGFLMSTVPYPVTKVPPRVYNFYRVRQGKRDHFFTNKCEFGLPPLSEDSAQGRCNKRGRQALYFAVTETTALHEACSVRRRESSEFHLAYISRWQNTVPVRIAKFLDVKAPFRDQHIRDKHSADMELMSRLHPGLMDEIRRLLHLVGRCFASPAERAPHAYSITNVVAEHVFNRFDGIYYSSAMRDAYGTSAALKPELLETAFAFQCVARVLYAPRDRVGQEFVPLTNALGRVVAPDGTLAWRENAGIFPSLFPSRDIEENWNVPG